MASRSRKRKKAKGKARKKKAAAVDAAGVVVSPAPVVRGRGTSSIHGLSLLSQLRLRNRNIVSSFSKSLPCTHGWNPSEYPHGHDGHKFIEAVAEMITNRQVSFFEIILFSSENDVVKNCLVSVDWIVSALIAIGSELVLQGAIDTDEYVVKAIAFSEALRQSQMTFLHRTQPAVYHARIEDLRYADIRRRISYMKKRIPCSCVDAEYKEVKSLPKTGLCSGCGGNYELSSLKSCGSCRKAHYCSKACQKADWKRHKEECNIWTNWLANNGGQPA